MLKSLVLVKLTWSSIPVLQGLDMLEPHFTLLLKKSLTIIHKLNNNVPTARHHPPPYPSYSPIFSHQFSLPGNQTTCLSLSYPVYKSGDNTYIY